MNQKDDLYRGYLMESVIHNIRLMGKEQTINALNQYINTGNPNGFTRQNNARAYLCQIPSIEILNLLNGKSLEDFFGWIDTEIKIRDEGRSRYSHVVNNIISAFETTYLKYIQNNPPEIVKGALMQKVDEVANHNCLGITRENNARYYLEEAIAPIRNPEQIYEALRIFLHENGYGTSTKEQIAEALLDYVQTKVEKTLYQDNSAKKM